jgi:hypothetical protein
VISAALLILAAAPDAVTLEASGCGPGLANSIRDELEAAGFPTRLTEDRDAQVARVVVHCAASEVVVRIEDRVTSKAVERTLVLAEGPRSEVLAAIQVVELLHASLAETRFASLMPVPVRVERFLAQREPAPPGSWNLAAAGGVSWAPGGFGAQPSVSLELSRPVITGTPWRLEFGGEVNATVRASLLQGTGGQAEVGLVEPRALVAAAWEHDAWTVRPRVSAGALVVWAVGHAQGVYGASSGATATFQVAIGGSVSRPVTPWLALEAGVDLSVAPIAVQVQFPDSTTRIGAPLLTAQLGVVFR